MVFPPHDGSRVASPPLSRVAVSVRFGSDVRAVAVGCELSDEFDAFGLDFPEVCESARQRDFDFPMGSAVFGTADLT